ncbi:unnamed protein product [Oikopleura dioica]|uniref:Uncharacterized protein n=1 Tax=Oikopleura dioica TaxID=34765 RepID=E4X142_OIKDI|nr:unnamed protein product [Oikopleura dioica]
MDVFFAGETQTPHYLEPVRQECQSSGQERAICECDKQLAQTFLTIRNQNSGQLNLLNTNYQAENCSKSGNGVDGELFCCKKITGSWSMYNNGKFCCSDFKLHSLGSCAREEGIKFKEEITIL